MINQKPREDNAVIQYEQHEYLPIAGTSLNGGGDVTIVIEQQHVITYPHDSGLLVEGRLTKADGTAYADADNVALTNNAIMHLFSEIKYHIDGKEIEYLHYPGHATTMKGLLSLQHGFSKSRGISQCWYKDNDSTAAIDANFGLKVRQSWIIKKPTAKGTFSFLIPLKFIFGFAEDYQRVVYGRRQRLTLNRSGDDSAIYRAGAAGAGKMVLSTVAWYMPHVTPNDIRTRCSFTNDSIPIKLWSSPLDGWIA